MSDALTQAFSDVDRSYFAAKSATGSTAAAALTSGVQGVGFQSSKLTKAAEQYQHFHGWPYVAIRAIASKISGQDIFVGKVLKQPKPGRKLELPGFAKSLGTRVEPLETHPLLSAIDCPNPLMVRWSLMFSTVASLMLTGRSYWWLTEGVEGLQIWPIPSHWIEPTDPLRGGWKLRTPGNATPIELPAEDVVPFVLPDPSDPFGSVSPLQSQALAVSSDEAIQRSQHDSFKNGIYPQLAVRVGSLQGTGGQQGERPVLTAAQRGEITDMVLKLYAGQHKKHHPLVLDGMIEGIDKLSTDPEEMDYLNSGNQTKSRILQAFGVNPITCGEVEGANRASAVVAQQSFCETINPIVELMSQSLTRWVAPRFADDGTLLAWIEPCKAHDAEQSLAEWKAAISSGYVTQNEYRTQVLNLQAVDGGDVFRDSLGNEIGGERSAQSSRFTLPNGKANGHGLLQ